MLKIEGTLIEVQEIAAKAAENGRAARPAYALAQILGEVVTFDGAAKKKVFDVAFKSSEPLKGLINKRVSAPVDVYGTGKGTISVRHIDGKPVESVQAR